MLISYATMTLVLSSGLLGGREALLVVLDDLGVIRLMLAWNGFAMRS